MTPVAGPQACADWVRRAAGGRLTGEWAIVVRLRCEENMQRILGNRLQIARVRAELARQRGIARWRV